MKPKDLRPAFHWDTRRVVLDDVILHVPAYYERYDEWLFPGWGHTTLFGNDHPVRIEYCSGHGHWIVERALEYPDINWVAIEMRFDRVRRIWAKLKNLALDNLLIISGEAYTATRHYLSTDSVEACYINFPDPWPKERHAKHRLVHPPFLKEVARILIPSSPLTFVTDDPDYAAQFIATAKEVEELGFVFPSPHFVTDWPEYGHSVFGKWWQNEGRSIHYIQVQAK